MAKKKYAVGYQFIGCIDVQAKDERDAENQVREMTTETLARCTEFEIGYADRIETRTRCLVPKNLKGG